MRYFLCNHQCCKSIQIEESHSPNRVPVGKQTLKEYYAMINWITSGYLDPKINQANITVLKGSLKAKIKFAIKVSLTKL